MTRTETIEGQGHRCIDIVCQCKQDYLDAHAEIDNEKEHPYYFFDKIQVKERVGTEIYMNDVLTRYSISICDCALNGSDEEFFANL